MIDWRQVLLQLRGTRLSYEDIALSTNVPCGTLRAIVARQSQPLYATGETLVTYWCERMSKTRDALPQVDAGATQVDAGATESDAGVSTLRECAVPSPIS